jgi:outer membrane protein assembly factor BamB
MQRSCFPRSLIRLALFVLWPALLAPSSRAENWSQFRGDDGTGMSTDCDYSSKWTPDRILWTVDLPGVGHSSPVIWGTKLFLTSANDSGTTRYLLCLDAQTGKRLWMRQMSFDASHKHAKNSWASSTPALDGERIYFVFADSERQVLAAYDFEGNSVWDKNLGSFTSQHAQGVSPIVFEDTVILANDQDGPSSIIACDKRTGHTVWSAPRKSAPQSTSYATPFVYRRKDGPPQLICSSSLSGVSALDPHTGQTIWTTKSLPQRTVASPVLAGGLLFQCCGAAGQGTLMVAVDPGGQGDVSKTHVRYKRTKILPYVPTPVAFRDNLFLWSDHGVVCCMNPLTGKDAWTKRIGGDFSSSPICAGGMLFNMDEAGDVIVLSASNEFKPLGRIPLGDPSHSTPAIANGRLYFRTFHHLACVAARP